MKVSIVLRTYNEQKHLRSLLEGIQAQQGVPGGIETVIVDSGSTDQTLEIARQFPVKIVPIPKAEFSFGRSLNLGCAAAEGDALVFVSGHCIPVDEHWISQLIQPLGKRGVVYTYGRQLGGEDTYFSETRIFAKYFPCHDKLPQDNFYCNNANAALLKSVWSTNRFDESLTGLEDMHLARRLVGQGMKIGYVANAGVFHLHSETWAQVRRRFEREAIALQHIMPEVHLQLMDVCRYFVKAVIYDSREAVAQGLLRENFSSIFRYRLEQFLGAYRGNHIHRELSRLAKERYFYPR